MKKALFRFIGCVAGVPLAAFLLPGLAYANIEMALAAGVLLGAVYMVVRPLARLILIPLGILTLGLVYVALDALLLWFVVARFPGIEIQAFTTAVAASIIINLTRAMLAGLIKK